jgi:hypothetical protein
MGDNDEVNDRLDNWLDMNMLTAGILVGVLLVIVGAITLYQFGGIAAGFVVGFIMIIVGAVIVMGVVKFARAEHED